MKAPTPADYALIFQDHRVGAAIFEELVQLFHGNPYVKGGIEAQRETDARAGAMRPIDHILRKLNQAAGHEPLEPVTDLSPPQE